MLRLLLLRHSKAGWPPATHDAERPLAKRGQAAAPLIGQYMKDHGLEPDLVLVSSSRRTRETWDLIRPIMGDIETRFDGRIYEAPVGRLVSVLQEVGPNVGTVLMIGHNPGCEDLAAYLTGDGDRDSILRLGHKFPTSGLAVIDLPHEAWSEIKRRTGHLERFVTPKSLGSADDD